jgi:hypothetical protein
MEQRPRFVQGGEQEKRQGFSLFSWMRPGLQEPPAVPPVRVTTEPEPEAKRAPVSDPALDEELEIPAFLRRQMTQR